MNDTGTIITKLNEINAIIHEAQMNLAQGNVTKMAHIEAEVTQLCEQVLQLPPTEAKKVQPIMADMIGKLDTLATSLKSFQTELKEKIK